MTNPTTAVLGLARQEVLDAAKLIQAEPGLCTYEAVMTALDKAMGLAYESGRMAASTPKKRCQTLESGLKSVPQVCVTSMSTPGTTSACS
jgi:hypothetical protein